MTYPYCMNLNMLTAYEKVKNLGCQKKDSAIFVNEIYFCFKEDA